MSKLNLQLNSQTDATIVSNRFIDEYMPVANGEFIKIYLYLLRSVSTGFPELSITLIADKFEHTEKDVLRALCYWEKMKLMKLSYDSQKTLTGIQFLDFPGSFHFEGSAVSDTTEVASTASREKPAGRQKLKPQAAHVTLSSKESCYTPDKLLELKNKDEIKQLLFIAEQYLEKTLSVTETSNILYFYEGLHFSVDLIEYLIEYCVSKGSKSIRYIETVALAWAEDGIETVRQAKETSNLYHKNCFAVLKAFGIKGRNPAESEAAFINKWSAEYGFELDIILEACKRTISLTHQPSFEYADSILRRWNTKGVKHLPDIQLLDVQHQKTKESQQAPARAKLTANNKFNNFSQTAYDFTELEKELLSN